VGNVNAGEPGKPGEHGTGQQGGAGGAGGQGGHGLGDGSGGTGGVGGVGGSGGLRGWYLDRRVLAAVLVAVLCIGGYQVYAQRQAGKVAKVTTTVEHMTDAQCSTARLFYAVFNALVEDSTPRFGSPPDGPIIPGARLALIQRLYNSERATIPGLRRQGCKVPMPPR
jgi:hypothetical protein